MVGGVAVSYHQQSFAARSGAMGDQAEFVFETVWPAAWVRFGLNRPPLQMSSLPEMLRHSPDYLTSKCFVEVAGFGTDQVFKWKDVKQVSLLSWNDIFDTRVFIFDSKNKRYGDCSIEELGSVLRKKQVTSAAFHDGPTYKAIPADVLPVHWMDVA